MMRTGFVGRLCAPAKAGNSISRHAGNVFRSLIVARSILNLARASTAASVACFVTHDMRAGPYYLADALELAGAASIIFSNSALSRTCDHMG